MRVKFFSIAFCILACAGLLNADVVQPAAHNFYFVTPTNAFFSGPMVYIPGFGWSAGQGTQTAGQEWNDVGSQNPDYGILGHVPFLWYGGYQDQPVTPLPAVTDPCGQYAFGVTSNLGANQSQSTSHFLFGNDECKDDTKVWPSTFIPNRPPDKPVIPDESDRPEQPIPEPSTIALCGAGIIAILWRMKK